MARIAVVGTGYVGLTTGACFAHLGHMVCCIDVDRSKIDRLQAGDVPIFEPGMEILVSENLAQGGLSFTSDYEFGLTDVDYVFIAVGTPPAGDGASADMRHVHSATRAIAQTLKAPAIIVNKSTSPIGTGDDLRHMLDEANPSLAPWRVVSNPEFLREGNAIYDCLNPARIVLGSSDSESCDLVTKDLYAEFSCPVIATDLRSAEMIKYASNAFLATKISFINEVARICDALYADVTTVARGMGLDERIGGHFLNAGLGYGGSCFPKDVSALAHMADSAGLHPQLLKAVVDINDDQRRWAVETLRARLGTLEDRTIAIWGVAFKPQTDDLRHAPALDIAGRLRKAGATVNLFDPVADLPAEADRLFPSPIEAATGADAVLVATEWPEFLALDWRDVASVLEGNLIFDGRNCLDSEAVQAAGLTYVGVGRRPSAALSKELISA